MYLVCKQETWKRNGEVIDYKSEDIKQCNHCGNGERVEFKAKGRTVKYDVFLCNATGRYTCVVVN